MITTLTRLACLLDITRTVDFLAPLALRLYLAPVFWMAGMSKLNHFDDTVAWFGNPDWGLGLPLPGLMTALAIFAELGGAVCLVLGLCLRWMAVPMMVTMIVAALTVHAEYGWQAIADPSAPFANERVEASAEKLERARGILREHGNYEWLSSSGKLVVLNNGVEFAVTYLIMLLSLFFTGAGRFLSIDYWARRRLLGPESKGP